MAITFKVVSDKNYFVSTWGGNITDSEMHNSYESIFQGHAWKPTLNELVDLREIFITSITSNGIIKLTEIAEHYLTKHNITEMKTAVVSEDSLSNGMVKFYESLMINSSETIQIFQGFEQADDWLSS